MNEEEIIKLAGSMLNDEFQGNIFVEMYKQGYNQAKKIEGDKRYLQALEDVEKKFRRLCVCYCLPEGKCSWCKDLKELKEAKEDENN